MRAFFVVLVPALALGCAHNPETKLHLHSPESARWEVRDHEGAMLCALPCTVGLDRDQEVVVARTGGGAAFNVRQGMMGKGDFDGGIRKRREPSAALVALGAVANALVGAGTALAYSRDDRRAGAGLILTTLGTVGTIATSAWEGRGSGREELWIVPSGAAAPKDDGDP